MKIKFTEMLGLIKMKINIFFIFSQLTIAFRMITQLPTCRHKYTTMRDSNKPKMKY